MPQRHEPAPPPRRPVPRRDDGPLPTPVIVDVERDLWRAGYRDWDADGREEMVAERKASRAGDE